MNEHLGFMSEMEAILLLSQLPNLQRSLAYGKSHPLSGRLLAIMGQHVGVESWTDTESSGLLDSPKGSEGLSG